MCEFGEELRQERESRGIALELITGATKISSRYLVALETGQFNHLPGGVINKGIVRGYARVVGLDEEAWVNRFMSAYQGSGQLTDDDASWIAFAENVGKHRSQADSRPILHLRWGSVAVLLVVLAALGWFVYSYVSDRTTIQAAAHPAAAATVLPSQR
jgi:cytoskeletal protein RodZ